MWKLQFLVQISVRLPVKELFQVDNFVTSDIYKPIEDSIKELKSMTYVSQVDLIIFIRDCYRNDGPISRHILSSIMKSPIRKFSSRDESDLGVSFCLKRDSTALEGYTFMYINRILVLPIVNDFQQVIGIITLT
jgi:hypothetical protein